MFMYVYSIHASCVPVWIKLTLRENKMRMDFHWLFLLCYHPQYAPLEPFWPSSSTNMVLHKNELTYRKVHMHHELQDVKMNQ